VQQAYYCIARSSRKTGLDFKLGVWDTIIGIEVFDRPSTDFNRSYGYRWSRRTHTGLLATLPILRNASQNVGIANTWRQTIKAARSSQHPPNSQAESGRPTWIL